MLCYPVKYTPKVRFIVRRIRTSDRDVGCGVCPYLNTKRCAKRKTLHTLLYINRIQYFLIILLLLTLRIYITYIGDYRISVSTLLVAIPFLWKKESRAVKSSDVNSGWPTPIFLLPVNFSKFILAFKSLSIDNPHLGHT